tara:strand:- start:1194 stop:1739 length:546 start_codon:yes stop_codon:yes gene_type:complete
MVWKHDGKNLTVGKSWTDGTYKHPYNWATAWTDQNKKDWGVAWEDDPDISFDDRFYWSKGIEKALVDSDATDESGSKIKDADGNQVINYGLKTIWVRQTKQRANDMLAKTDWEVTRKSEKGTAIASATTTFRDKVRTACNTIETKINDCANLTAFKALFDVPKDSDGVVTGNAPIYDFPKE